MLEQNQKGANYSAKPKIMVGITTYNRKDILDKVAKSFNQINGIDDLYVCIFDDCSVEYDAAYLKSIFKKVDYVHVNEKNLGSDYNIRLFYTHFLESDCEWLLNADSDLIFNKDIIGQITSLFEKTNGIFSVFNTPNHLTRAEYDDTFIEKNDVGSAGVVINKELVKKIIQHIPAHKRLGFDWEFCDFLRSQNIKILVTRKSLCQHVGFYGQNSLFKFDYGVGFEPDSKINAQIVEKLAEDVFGNGYCFVKEDSSILNILYFLKHLIIHYVIAHILKKQR